MAEEETKNSMEHEVESYTQDGRFVYCLLEDGTAEIMGAGPEMRIWIHEPGKKNSMLIPSVIDDHRVTKIGQDAFREFRPVVEFVIEQGVKHIGKNAFADCRRLEKVVIPPSVEHIDEGAFDIFRKVHRQIKQDWKQEIKDKEIILEEVALDEADKDERYPRFSVMDIKKTSIPDELEPIYPNIYNLTLVVEENSYAQTYAMENGFFYTCGDWIEGDFAYRLHGDDQDGTVDVMAYLGRRKKEVIIPEKIRGKVVSGISREAFLRHAEIEKIVMPESVTRIGVHAFRECIGLKEIVFPKNLKRIDFDAFYRCENLEKIELPEQVEEIDSCAFMACYRLEEVRIPGSVKNIESGVFGRCTALHTVRIGEGVCGIKAEAFSSCRSLKYVIVPSSVKLISWHAFDRKSGAALVVNENTYAHSLARKRNMQHMSMGCCIRMRNEDRKKEEKNRRGKKRIRRER
ncbi:MAG: hypothetical protein E7321_01505 [Clostridiales bacterium]|nr:hypothetical protein [Clostridiales bacterium]